MNKVLFLRNIKKGYATNSSSYHSTMILTEEEYNKWVNEEIKIEDSWGEKVSYDEWEGESETDTTHHTTVSGDKIVILCRHGSDY